MTEHKILSELRFPEFKEEWKFQKLGNLAQFSKGKSLSKRFKYKWKSLHFIWRIIY